MRVSFRFQSQSNRQYAARRTACSGESAPFTLNARALWGGDEGEEFEVDIGGPEHGVIIGDFAAPPLRYASATGFSGRDTVTVWVEAPFGSHATGRIDVTVIECPETSRDPIAVRKGEILPIIVPTTFGVVMDTAWSTVALLSLADGTEYPEALSAASSGEDDGYVLNADTAQLPSGGYLLTIPLGNGKAVELTISVEAAK